MKPPLPLYSEQPEIDRAKPIKIILRSAGYALIEIDATMCSIPGWPELKAAIHRPVDFGGIDAMVEKTGWKVSHPDCGISYMHGGIGDTKQKAIAIAVSNLSGVLKRFSRERILKEYEREISKCNNQK